MDAFQARELHKLADQQITLAKQYLEARTKAGEAKKDLDILLAAVFSAIRGKKANAGYEVSLIMLMEDNKVARELYEEMVSNTAKYKGLEKVLNAYQDKISLSQSVMKYIGRGEAYGA